MSNTLETIIREIKKVAELMLTHECPLNKVINACNRFISLKEFARINIVMQELVDGLQANDKYVKRLRRLIIDVNKRLK